jgi:type II secretory ATPase GspE/PulE/Tfp pilus assembly ATPase PilB-like protein
MIKYAELEKRFPKLLKDLEPYDHFPIDTSTKYVRILDEIERTWSTPDCSEHLRNLIFSDRTNRQGFPRAVLHEILFLRELDQFIYGAEQAKKAAAILAFPNETIKPTPPVGFRLAQTKPQTIGAGLPPTASDISSDADAKVSWPIASSAEELLKRIQGKAKLDSAAATEKRRLGEILLQFSVITEDDLKYALTLQSESSPRAMLGKVLSNAKLATVTNVIKALCLQQQILLTDPAAIISSPELLKLIPLHEAIEKCVAPLLIFDRTIYLAVPNPFIFQWTDYFKFLTGKRIQLVQADRERILRSIESMSQSEEESPKNRHLVSDKDGNEEGEESNDEGAVDAEASEDDDGGSEGFYSSLDLPDETVDQSDSSVIGLVNRILNDAARLGASDVHIEIFPRAKNGQVRLRRDGIMEPYSEIPGSYYPAIVSRIKIMAGIDISERRRPQDGRISFATSNRKRLELRVATLPTVAGVEAVVIRLLSQAGPLPLGEIGLASDLLLDFKSHLSNPHGLVLVCGPTGSGKTTTLHSALKFLNTPHRKIWTAEDPVEITQRNVNQVQINHKIGLGFAQVLRSFLRADPDVIMIGEMRDAETAQIAVESAMTGHLVLSTLHTNSAAETVARVLDMGIDQFNFSDALQAVLAQRLVRRVCKECSEIVEPTGDELNALAEEFYFSGSHKKPTAAQRDQIIGRWREQFATAGKLQLARPHGCEKCMGTGYHGRVGVHELLSANDPEMRQLVRARASAEILQAKALARGMRTLKQDGIDKILQGLTTIQEVRAVCV